ncbi:MAG: hypothetical protein WC933_03685 [Candidatus Paceibacterota bacterium]|jgi:hypothetical protein
MQFKKITADEFDDFCSSNFLEMDGLWEFLENEEVSLSFDEPILTIRIKLKDGTEKKE